jgi:ATP-dependent helicase Lhr and Lhr-like helicase
VRGRIVHMVLSRVSPLAVPVLLEIGRESVRSDADEEKLLAEAEAIIAEATGEREPPHRGVPDRSGVKTIHRRSVARKDKSAQMALFRH